MTSPFFIHISASSNDVFPQVKENDLLMYSKASNNSIFIGSSNTTNYIQLDKSGTLINNKLHVKGELSIENQGIEITSQNNVNILTNNWNIKGDMSVEGSMNVAGHLTYNTISQLSDARFKHDIEPITSATEYLLDTKPVTYKKQSMGEVKESGFIAQELLNTKLKDLVFSYDNDTLSINYSGFIAYIVKSIQEINNRLEALE